MHNLHIILISILALSFIFNYLSFSSKRTALQMVNDMGIGYNLGNTYYGILLNNVNIYFFLCGLF